MFTSSRAEDKKFEVFPESALKNSPIFETAPQYTLPPYNFRLRQGQDVAQLLQTCREMKSNYGVIHQPQTSSLMETFARDHCPDHPDNVLSECGDNIPCLYDYTMLGSKRLGIESKNNWDRFVNDRLVATRQYNSCGPINIEYPEYMMKTPAMSSGYLQGDVARFDCFQSHWVKGDNEYRCSMVTAVNNRENYRFEWNKGWQPWCRSRERDNLLKWLTSLFTALGVVMLLVLIFVCCWTSKKKRVNYARSRRSSSRSTNFNRPLKTDYSLVKKPLEQQPIAGMKGDLRGYSNEGLNIVHSKNPPDTASLVNYGPMSRTDQWTPPSDFSIPPLYTIPTTRQSGLLGLNTSV